MKNLLLAASIALMSTAAIAQNTKGMDSQSATSTTTNPGGSVGQTAPSADGRTQANRPSGTNRSRMDATQKAQDEYEKQGKSGASLR